MIGLGKAPEIAFAALSAALGMVVLLTASGLESLLEHEEGFARATHNEKFADALKGSRSRLLDGSAGDDGEGVLIGYTVALVLTGTAASIRFDHLVSRWLALVSEVTLLVLMAVWFIVSVSSCTYAQRQVKCYNNAPLLANDVLEAVR